MRRRLLTALLTFPFLSACIDSGSSSSSGDEQPATLTSATASAPALEVSRTDLQESLECHGNPSGGEQPVVLLVPGTTQTPEVNFSWNYIPALRDMDRVVCTVESPERAMGDIQVAADHAVFAIRDLFQRSGQPIQIIGHSQGGMMPRWAFKFWPDTREMVSDLIGLAPSNQGTILAKLPCAGNCAPAFHQQAQGSEFLRVLNETGPQTYPEIDYSVIYTRYDEVVMPSFPSSVAAPRLEGDGDNLRNIEIQSVCPLNVSEHLGAGTYDPVGWALAKDALENDGPTDPDRVSRRVCLELLMPGVDPVTFVPDALEAATFLLESTVTSEMVSEEPELKCYARDGGC